jgi:signal transduction histidine kinase
VEKLLNHTRYFIIFIVASTLAITYLHFSTLPAIKELHNIFTELYYVPLLLGAFVFGLKGAILTYIFVTSFYIPYIIINWSGTYLFVVNQLFHAIFSGSFAVIAGVLVDREKKRRQQAEKNRYLVRLGQAAAAIVHDLRNPLISILGFARRIHQEKGDIKVASQIVLKSAEDMQVIVNDVLDFAKPIKITCKEADIVKTLKEICTYCRPYAALKRVKLLVEFSVVPLSITADISHFKRALVNLINNAIDASGWDESVIVNVSSGYECLIIKINDHGVGMEKDILENIFVPFYSNKTSGTGLGMAIAKKVIEAHKGNIRINSEPGQGTEVAIELPQYLQ